MTEFWNSIVTIALAIIGVAFLAVILSRQSNTVGVTGAASQAFNTGLATALSPVTGTGGGSLPNALGNVGIQPASYI